MSVLLPNKLLLESTSRPANLIAQSLNNTSPQTSQTTRPTRSAQSYASKSRSARAPPLPQRNLQILSGQTTSATAAKRMSFSAVEPGDPVPQRKKRPHHRPFNAEAPILAAGEGDCDDACAAEPRAAVAEPGGSSAAGGGGGVFGAFV
ncbi:hypothetical protein V496_01252 [Pseudogymnoascus sp. VKM F-4515 (FW-2607)]|nr:hypothetical protein V496_01252 [Pseudogymnoascus sp. VKM F-4515 (FW-2607)]